MVLPISPKCPLPLSRSLQRGDVFTLNLCGKYMTFLFDAAAIDTFFRAPDTQITFRPAVEQFTARVFGLPSREFFPKHANVLRDLRHLLVPAELHVHATELAGKVAALMGASFPLDKQVGPCLCVRNSEQVIPLA